MDIICRGATGSNPSKNGGGTPVTQKQKPTAS